jgi:spermidine dehydrogenase
VAAGLLTALGIDPAALASRHADSGFYSSLALGSGVFFDKETFGEDRLVRGKISSSEFLEHAPISETARRDIRRLETESIDYLPGLSSSEKKARLSRISYRDFLLDLVKVDPSVIPLYQARTHGEWGVGIDAVSALDVWPFGLPGFQGLKLDPGSAPHMGYTAAGYADGGSSKFHFPDGNASIARLLVRSLISEAVPGSTVEDIVTARIDYGRLDPADGNIRIRLGSTALSVGTRCRSRLLADGPSLHRKRQALCTRLLEHDDPASLSAIAGAAERGIALPGQSAASLYECSAVQLASVSRIGNIRGPLPGQLSFERPAKSGYRYRQLLLAPLPG